MHVSRCKGHTGTIRCLVSIGDWTFSGGDDQTILRWDARTVGSSAAAPPTELKGHIGVVQCLVNVNGFLYSGSSDRTVRKWDTQTG
eukprot:gene5930-5824_t